VFKISPVPASRPRVTKYGTYIAKTYAQYRKKISKQIDEMSIDLLTKPLYIETIFYMPIPKSFSKKMKDKLNGTFCTVGGDMDNLLKAIWDSLNGYAYIDDKQIVWSQGKKFYSFEPRIEILIKEI
jgi:Holliday junction resolvase RusA-like endonuclease